MPNVFWDGEKYREFRGASERPGPQRQVARAVRPGLGSSGLERYLAEVRRNGFWQTAQREVSLGNLDFGLGDSLYGASFGLRYTHTAEIIRLQILFRSSPYASGILRGVINKALAGGIQVETGADITDRLVREWRPMPEAPLASLIDLQYLLAMSMVRDGSGFGYKTMVGGEPKVQVLDAKNIPTQTASDLYEAGVYVTEDAEPVGYRYQQYTQGAQPDLGMQQILPADRVIHIFNTGDFPGAVRGLSWIQQSAQALQDVETFCSELSNVGLLNLRRAGVFKLPPSIYLEGQEQELSGQLTIASPELQDTAQNRLEIAADQIRKVMMSGMGGLDDNWVPSEVEWLPTPSAGFSNTTGLWNIYQMLGAKAAIGMGLTPYAFLGDWSALGFLGGSMAIGSDELVYDNIRRYVGCGIREAVDFYFRAVGLPGTEYELAMPTTMQGPIDKVAQYYEKLVEMGAMTPEKVAEMENVNG